MPDDSDPPRKFYDFKPRDFDRANTPASGNEPVLHPAQPSAPPSPPGPTDVHELHRLAALPGPVLRRDQRSGPNEIHAMLRDNHAREVAAGMHKVADKPKRKSRRWRDYILIMVVSNTILGLLAVYGLRSQNAVLFIYSVAGIGFISAGATWVMWFVMDDY